MNEHARTFAARPGAAQSIPTVHIVEAVDGGADADWGALAGSGATLVFRRGLPQVLQIVARLIAAGLARSTPAAVVCLAPQEACPTLSTSLGELPARIAGEPLPSTALIVVGVVLSVVLIGVPILIATAGWVLIRSVLSLVKAQTREPGPTPRSFSSRRKR